MINKCWTLFFSALNSLIIHWEAIKANLHLFMKNYEQIKVSRKFESEAKKKRKEKEK